MVATRRFCAGSFLLFWYIASMRINLVGGFLGSGKTTAIAAAARMLMADDENVGVITNDQGTQQVDTATIESLGIPSREVAGSCFCCNYDAFDAHIRSLETEYLPATIFAESVGTCTDLVATIVRPLHLYRPEMTVVITVFVDAAFLTSLLEGTSLFVEESVRYIYQKQLEEADLIVVNKADLITPAQREMISGMLATEYRGRPYLFQNSMQPEDIRRWLAAAEALKPLERKSLDLDYDVYGAGEAQMAWLDRQITISDAEGNAIQVARKLMEGIFRRINEDRLLIGHLKFFLDTDKWSRKVSFTPSSSDYHELRDDLVAETITVLINARVQTDPRRLTSIVDAAMDQTVRTGIRIEAGEWSAFVPGYPKPTHRM